MNKTAKKVMAITAVAVITVASILLAIYAGSPPPVLGEMAVLSTSPKEGTYRWYYDAQKSQLTETDGFQIDATRNFSGDAELSEDPSGQYLFLSDESVVFWTFSVEKAGYYTIGLTYRQNDGVGADIERAIRINGEVPFSEAESISLPVYWTNKSEIGQDLYGNDIRPIQVEYPQWSTFFVRDSKGYIDDPLCFWLNEGDNTISLEAVKGSMCLRSLTLQPPEEIADYTTVRDRYTQAAYTATQGEYIQIEGEKANIKSSPTLYPRSDTAGYATEPNEATKVKLNTIGGASWAYAGDFLVWDVPIEKAGLYQIAIKARQNITSGVVSTRRLYIDDVIPFEEVKNISFQYDSQWNTFVLADEEGTPFEFYFEEGTHTLKLEVTIGDMGQVLETAEQVLEELNAGYRDIIIVTGTNPDLMRDYKLEKLIPETIVNLRAQLEIIRDMKSALVGYAGENGGNSSILDTLIRQLETMTDQPADIVKNLSYFKTNIGALGDWINSSRELYLEIDYIAVYSPDVELKDPEAGFFENTWFAIRRFFNAFVSDYSQIGNIVEMGEDQTITVWSVAGRDQLQILKSLINDSFVPENNIAVNLELVEESALLPTTLAGIGPDVMLGAGQTLPVDYALRNAVAPLDGYEGFEEVAKRYPSTLFNSYRLNDHIYALPETISFPVMYYRTDILENLGAEIPQTWEDVISLTTLLSNNNMSFGVSTSEGMMLFYTILMQCGGDVYNAEGTECALSSDTAVSAFKFWTNLYANYGQQITLDFVNRFRTGECPIGIASQGVYNSLAVAAPEISGLWEFTVVPGTVQEDGSIDRTIWAGSACSIMMEQSQKKELAWQFLKWWSQDDIQLRFGREMESILGSSARYASANVAAYQALPWTRDEWNVLGSSLENAVSVREIPGGYFVSRHINNAFRKVVLKEEDARDTLIDYVTIINREIAGKRKEFGM